MTTISRSARSSAKLPSFANTSGLFKRRSQGMISNVFERRGSELERAYVPSWTYRVSESLNELSSIYTSGASEAPGSAVTTVGAAIAPTSEDAMGSALGPEGMEEEFMSEDRMDEEP